MFRKAFILSSRQCTLALSRRPCLSTTAPLNAKKTVADSLQKLDRLLQSPYDGDIQKLMYRSLTSTDAYNSFEERSAVYRKLVFLLTHSRRVEEAVWLQERMEKERMDIDPLSRGRLLVTRLFGISPAEAPSVWQALKDLFKSDEFLESHLLDLFHTFDWATDKSYHIPAKFITAFIESKGKSYAPPPGLISILVKVQTLAGKMREAYAALKDFNVDGNAPDPFISAINALSETPQSASDGWFDKVMGLMQEREVPGDVSLFNALIDREVSRGLYPRVLDFYEALRELHDSESLISPDAFTFASLFRAVFKLYDPKNRTEGSQFTPRHIFRDMVIIHFGSPDHSPPSDTTLMDMDQSLLNLALRAFLAHNDYPAAMVVLRCYARFGLPIDATTYQYIVKHVALQLHLDFEFNKGRCWSPRFLPSLDIPAQRRLLRPPPGRPLLELLLNSMQKPGHGVRYVVPTYDIMQGNRPAPPSARLDVIPLEDVLTRALYADVHLKSQRPNIAEGHIKMLADKALLGAEELMLPDVPTRDWGNGPKRRTVGRR